MKNQLFMSSNLEQQTEVEDHSSLLAEIDKMTPLVAGKDSQPLKEAYLDVENKKLYISLSEINAKKRTSFKPSLKDWLILKLKLLHIKYKNWKRKRLNKRIDTLVRKRSKTW